MNNMIKRIQQKPEIFHGILSGTVLFLTKIVLLVSGNWIFKLEPTYNILAFLVIFVAMILGGKGESKLREKFNFGRAWLSGIITIFIVLFISLLGDQVVYRTNPKLAEFTKQTQLEQLNASLPKLTFLPAALREEMLSKAEDADPREQYSVSTFLSNLFTFLFLNSFWAIWVALFTRKKKSLFSEDLVQ